MVEMLATVVGLLLVGGILWDSFETIILPRRVTRRLRLTSLFYRVTWPSVAILARRRATEAQRENFLALYGPLSLLLLLAVWAVGLIVGFALVQWGLGSQTRVPEGAPDFATDVYLSASTFFTLGLGDVTPVTRLARLVTVVEAGIGFGFLALVISYLPVLYQAFSRREVNISLLDARAGSPPCAAELFRRYSKSNKSTTIGPFLAEWERWAAELLESHLSYPVLGYFRSQHENQSWVAALTMILDACALAIASVENPGAARLTFAMARHAAVDLTQIFNTPPDPALPDRLPPADLDRLRAALAGTSLPLPDGPMVDQQLADLRASYEPYVAALAAYLLMPLPPWLPPSNMHDNWESTAWEPANITLLR